MVKDGYTIDIAKNVLQKAIVNELYKKEVIEFAVYNNIIKKLYEEIKKTSKNEESIGDLRQLIIEIPIGDIRIWICMLSEMHYHKEKD